MHPLIGLTGTLARYPYKGEGAGKNDAHGHLVAISQCGGFTNEGGEMYAAVVVLTDAGEMLEDAATRFTFDDPAEARRRLAPPPRSTFQE